mgnify:CR=1 FL=1|jgi:MOSC domain-containing protein YiiM
MCWTRDAVFQTSTTFMQVLHVNRAEPRNVLIQGKDVPTGIDKEPVAGPVHVYQLGLEGDGQADLSVHGGPYQAVYAYPVEHYGYWEAELAAPPFPPGTFGENLTVQGLLETDLCIGDVLAFGGLVLQVTCPRIPCFKLGNKLHKPDILKAFLHSGRSGFYFRVLTEGSISAGTAIKIMERDPRKITVRALLGMYRLGEGDRKSIESALEIDALSPLVRKDLETRFAKSRELK